MTRITVGIDPDAKKYGVAIYYDHKLTSLFSYETPELVKMLNALKKESNVKIVIVLEDLKKNKFVYRQHVKDKNKDASLAVAQSVGKCKQAQTVAEQFIEAIGLELIKYPPTKGNWAKDKKKFERITKWKSRSNEDTRSAAFLAFLHILK